VRTILTFATILIFFSFPSHASDGPKLGTNYVLVDKFCADGSEPLEKPGTFKDQLTIQFNEKTMIVSFKDLPGTFSLDYRIEGNNLTTMMSDGTVLATGTMRMAGPLLIWINDLPANKERAAKICPNGSHIVTIYRRQNAQNR